jgi:hypothetical protein
MLSSGSMAAMPPVAGVGAWIGGLRKACDGARRDYERASKAERNGLAAKCCFHSLGVSSATREAGC